MEFDRSIGDLLIFMLLFVFIRTWGNQNDMPMARNRRTNGNAQQRGPGLKASTQQQILKKEEKKKKSRTLCASRRFQNVFLAHLSLVLFSSPVHNFPPFQPSLVPLEKLAPFPTFPCAALEIRK